MRELARLLNENHRYFPEWADRPEISGPPVESDHNSYLAGGYSEEFGYRVSVDQPPVFSPLEGDPDGSRLWYVQVTGLHPGYPECARPDDRDHFRGSGRRDSSQIFHGAQAAPTCARGFAAGSRESALPFHVIRVGGRARNAAHHDGLATKLTSFWARWWSARRGLDH